MGIKRLVKTAVDADITLTLGDATGYTESQYVGDASGASYQIVQTSGAGITLETIVQVSNDGENWADITSATDDRMITPYEYHQLYQRLKITRVGGGPTRIFTVTTTIRNMED